MESTTLEYLFIALAVLGITILIYYFIIKAAVQAANADVLRQLQVLTALKVEK